MTTPSRGGRLGTSFDQLVPVAIGAGAPDKPRVPVIYDARGQTWFPAGDPLPVQVQNVEPRVIDFPTFWNRQTIQSAKSRDSGVTFPQLRALAKQTHVRVVLETVKDRQSKVEWSYTLRPKPGETPTQTRNRAKNDPRTLQAEEFFAQPEPEHDWTDWLRNLLEQVLVCDNLSLLRRGYEFDEARRIFYGEESNAPVAIEIIDGDTILPLIDNTGRRPVPPDAAYEQWIHGVVVDKFCTPLQPGVAAPLDDNGQPMAQLLYMPRNVSSNRIYGFSPAEQLLFYINMILRRDITKLDFYTKGNMPAGFMPMPEGWTPAQVRTFTDWLNLELSGDQENRSKIWPVPGGTGKVDVPQRDIMQDQFDDAWLRLVCFCFSIPVSSLVREQNRATADTSKQQAQEEGEQVLTNWLAKVQTRILRHWFGWPDVYAVPKDQLELDAEKRNKILDLQLRNGSLQIDEVRDEQGREPFNLPPGFVTPTGYMLLPTPDQQAEEAAQQEANAERQQQIAEARTQNGVPQPNGNQNEPAQKLVKKKLPTLRKPHIVAKYHPVLMLRVAQFLRDQAPTVAASFSEAYRAKLGKAVGDGPTLDWDGLISIITPALKAVYEEGGEESAADLDLSPFNQLNERALDYARRRGAELVGKKWVDGELVDNPDAQYVITETTRDDLRRLEAQAFEKGWSPEELAQHIIDLIDDQVRAELIADTELAFAQQAGSLAEWKESGVVSGKQSLLSNDHDTEDECDENADAGVIDIDEPFPSGDDTSPYHPRCECDVVAVVEGEE